MQRKIGEVFTTSDGVTLEVKEENSKINRCSGCYFDRNGCPEIEWKNAGDCNGVIFVEIEPEKE